MQTIKGMFIILLLWLLGNLLSNLMGGFMPGNVLGMLLMFLSLQLGLVKLKSVKGPADRLLQYMALFFVPAGVGLMSHLGLIAQHWLLLVVAVVGSTLLMLVVVAWLAQKLEKKHE